MPNVANPQEINFFGMTNFRNQQRKFGIRLDDRRRHMYIVGKTGMGKTTLLENMVIQDVISGHGLAYVDPHGDTAEKILEFIPPSRINDVVYFNPSDLNYPVAFNVVEQVDPRMRHLVASGLVTVFKKLWVDSWGPRLEYILRNAILAVLDYPGSTLLAVTRMLSDKAFRKKVIEKIQDPVVRAFWINEFTGYADKFASEAVAPIQNKVGQFLSTSLIRNVVCQVKSTIDVREIMDEGKILILNLSKGRIGEDSSALLGAMMITKIQLAAMGRVNIPESDRKDFFLYVDEFQNFATEAFASILSEARKYRLNLTMAHQYIEQLSEEVRSAVFGNVGTIMSFRIGASDAAVLAKEFAPRFTEEDLVNLTKFEIYLKLMINGVASEPFSALTLPPLFQAEASGTAEKVIRVSRERYAKDREIVEEKINRWSESLDEESTNETKAASAPLIGEIVFQGQTIRAEISDKATPERTIAWLCNKCKKITHLSFQPNPKKPVYCKKCLKEIQNQPAPAGSGAAIIVSGPPGTVPRSTAPTLEAVATPVMPPLAPETVSAPIAAAAPQPTEVEVTTIETTPPLAQSSVAAVSVSVPTPAVSATSAEEGGVLSSLEQKIRSGQDQPRTFGQDRDRSRPQRSNSGRHNGPRRDNRPPRPLNQFHTPVSKD